MNLLRRYLKWVREREMTFPNLRCKYLGHKWRTVGHFMDIECVRCGAWDGAK